MVTVDNAIAMPDADKSRRHRRRGHARWRGLPWAEQVDPSQLGSLVPDKLAGQDRQDHLLSAPMPAPSTRRSKTPSTMCARPVWKRLVCLTQKARGQSWPAAANNSGAAIVSFNDFEETRSLSHGNVYGAAAAAWREINVTPMIDILLVLLIIFMVIVPVTPQGSGCAGTPTP